MGKEHQFASDGELPDPTANIEMLLKEGHAAELVAILELDKAYRRDKRGLRRNEHEIRRNLSFWVISLAELIFIAASDLSQSSEAKGFTVVLAVIAYLISSGFAFVSFEKRMQDDLESTTSVLQYRIFDNKKEIIRKLIEIGLLPATEDNMHELLNTIRKNKRLIYTELTAEAKLRADMTDREDFQRLVESVSPPESPVTAEELLEDQVGYQ